MGQLCTCTRSQKKAFRRNTILPSKTILPEPSSNRPSLRSSTLYMPTVITPLDNTTLSDPSENDQSTVILDQQEWNADRRCPSNSASSARSLRTSLGGECEIICKNASETFASPCFEKNYPNEQLPTLLPVLESKTGSNTDAPEVASDSDDDNLATSSSVEDVNYSTNSFANAIISQRMQDSVIMDPVTSGNGHVMSYADEQYAKRMKIQAQKIRNILQKVIELLATEIDPVYIERYFRKTRFSNLPSNDLSEDHLFRDVNRLPVQDLLWDIITGEEAENFDIFCDVIGSEDNQRRLVNLLLALDSVIALVSPEFALDEDIVTVDTSFSTDYFAGGCDCSKSDRHKRESASEASDFNIELVTETMYHSVDPANCKNWFSNFAARDSSSLSLTGSCSPSIIWDENGMIPVASPMLSVNLLNYCLCVGQRRSRLVQILTECDCIHDISLIKNHLDEEGINCLAEGLKSNYSLVQLDLRLSSLGNDGAVRLGEALRHNTTLRLLNVTSVGLTETGCEGLMVGLTQNRHLSELDIGYNDIRDGGCRSVAETLICSCPLRKLRMRDNGITCVGASFLFRSLSRNSRLSLLDVSSNSLGNDSARHLSEALIYNRTLRELNLENCRIAITGCALIARAIRANAVLKTLQLSLNPLSDGGLEFLADALRYNHSIEVLCINMCGFGNSGFFRLLQALRYNSSLRTIKMCYNNVGTSVIHPQSRDDFFANGDHVTPTVDELYEKIREILHYNPNLKLLLWGNQMVEPNLDYRDSESQSSVELSFPCREITVCT